MLDSLSAQADAPRTERLLQSKRSATANETFDDLTKTWEYLE